MPTYTVTFEATVCVTVEAEDKTQAESEAQRLFRWTDVEITDVIDIEEEG